MEEVMESRNALWRREHQLRCWDTSETNSASSTPRDRQLSAVKFHDACVFLAACCSGDTTEVTWLLGRGADINTANVDGLTALHQACIDDSLSMVEFLVDHGADIEASDNEGWTALHATASCGFVDIARYLMEKGARLDAVNNDAELPIDLADGTDMENLLSDAMETQGVDAETARREEEQMMLRDANQWRNARSYSEQPHPKTGAYALHVAAAKGYIKLIKLLIEAGADVNASDVDGWTPMHAAAHWGQDEACRLLAEHWADMSAVDHVGRTPLDVSDPDVETLLEELKKQVDLMKRDAENRNTNAELIPENSPGKSGVRRSSVTRLSVDQKQGLLQRTTQDERQRLHSALSRDRDITSDDVDHDDDVPPLSSEICLDNTQADEKDLDDVKRVFPHQNNEPSVSTDPQEEQTVNGEVSVSVCLMNGVTATDAAAADDDDVSKPAASDISGEISLSNDEESTASTAAAQSKYRTDRASDPYARYKAQLTAFRRDSPAALNGVSKTSQSAVTSASPPVTTAGTTFGFRRAMPVPVSSSDVTPQQSPSVTSSQQSSSLTHSLLSSYVTSRVSATSVTTSVTSSVTPSVRPSVTSSVTPSVTPSDVITQLLTSVMPSVTTSVTTSVTSSVTPSDVSTQLLTSVTSSVTSSVTPSVTSSNAASRLSTSSSVGHRQLPFVPPGVTSSYVTQRQSVPWRRAVQPSSVAHTTKTDSTATTIRRSSEIPKRDEEKEIERKARAKRARESRRSTQGVTKEDVEKAGASLQAASRGSTSSDDSSVTSPVSTSDVSPVTTSVTTSSVSAAVTSPVSTSDVSPVTTSVTTSSVSAAVTNTSDVTRSLRNEVRKLSSTMLADVDDDPLRSYRKSRDSSSSFGEMGTSFSTGFMRSLRDASIAAALAAAPSSSVPSSAVTMTTATMTTAAVTMSSATVANSTTSISSSTQQRVASQPRDTVEQTSVNSTSITEDGEDSLVMTAAARARRRRESRQRQPIGAQTVSLESNCSILRRPVSSAAGSDTEALPLSRPAVHVDRTPVTCLAITGCSYSLVSSSSSPTTQTSTAVSTTTQPDNVIADFKTMYDDERRVREELHGELADVSRELSDTRLQLDRLRNLRSSSSVSSADINNERRERRALERKISALEEEVKVVEALRAENQRLRDENGALIRVISKLSKQ